MSENIEHKLKFSSPDEEIEFLRSQIAEKERELESQPGAPSREEIVRSEIATYKEKEPGHVLSKNLEMKVKDGTLAMVTGREMINDVDLNIQRMESRIKLLIFSSPDLKFNSDGVNFIEIKILEARERVFFALINVERGEATDPSELAMLTALQGTITAEDFTIPGL